MQDDGRQQFDRLGQNVTLDISRLQRQWIPVFMLVVWVAASFGFSICRVYKETQTRQTVSAQDAE